MLASLLSLLALASLGASALAPPGITAAPLAKRDSITSDVNSLASEFNSFTSQYSGDAALGSLISNFDQLATATFTDPAQVYSAAESILNAPAVKAAAATDAPVAQFVSVAQAGLSAASTAYASALTATPTPATTTIKSGSERLMVSGGLVAAIVAVGISLFW